MQRRMRRLETLVRLRKQEEDARVRELGAVRRDIASAMNQRDSIGEMQRAMLEDAAKRTRAQFSADEMQRFYQFERHLAGLAIDADSAIQEMRTVEAERLEDLKDANRRKRTMEKLAENALADRAAHTTKTERQLIDEVAINRNALGRRFES
jgi:flagellar export protein FliJ